MYQLEQKQAGNPFTRASVRWQYSPGPPGLLHKTREKGKVKSLGILNTLTKKDIPGGIGFPRIRLSLGRQERRVCHSERAEVWKTELKKYSFVVQKDHWGYEETSAAVENSWLRKETQHEDWKEDRRASLAPWELRQLVPPAKGKKFYRESKESALATNSSRYWWQPKMEMSSREMRWSDGASALTSTREGMAHCAHCVRSIFPISALRAFTE